MLAAVSCLRLYPFWRRVPRAEPKGESWWRCTGAGCYEGCTLRALWRPRPLRPLTAFSLVPAQGSMVAFLGGDVLTWSEKAPVASVACMGGVGEAGGLILWLDCGE